MGHLRLGRLPRSRSWKQVIALIEDGASAGPVAAASLRGVRSSLRSAAKDPGLAQSYWLLVQITEASRSDDFVSSLRTAGLEIPDSPTLFDITSAFSGFLERHRLATRGHSDVSEMAQFAAVESLTRITEGQLPTLFGTDTRDVQAAIRSVSTEKGFGKLTRMFLGRFLNRFLGYFISRELSNHVGTGKRFQSIADHADFNDALRTHCSQAARITEEFAGGWLGKTKHELGSIPEESVQRFLHVAVDKISRELARG